MTRYRIVQCYVPSDHWLDNALKDPYAVFGVLAEFLPRLFRSLLRLFRALGEWRILTVKTGKKKFKTVTESCRINKSKRIAWSRQRLGRYAALVVHKYVETLGGCGERASCKRNSKPLFNRYVSITVVRRNQIAISLVSNNRTKRSLSYGTRPRNVRTIFRYGSICFSRKHDVVIVPNGRKLRPQLGFFK